MSSISIGFKEFDWTLSLAHHGAYLSVDDILATGERVPCRLRSSIPKLAPLLLGSCCTQQPRGRRNGQGISDDLNDEEDFDVDVPAGTKVDLPLWLVFSVGSSRRQLLALDLPIIYREGYREVFSADPWVVDLRKKGPYFYSIGCHLLNLSNPELLSVITTVENAFQRRFKVLMEVALNANRRDIQALTTRLEDLELALFRIGQRDRLHLERWSSRHHERLEASSVAKETIELIAREKEAESRQNSLATGEMPPDVN
uniref:DNA replication complex GINS protein PSF3 n=1 Tax=Schistocephalus solidus TaxID=70667 RepID=A0A0X3PDU6_SCHSO